jgi:hypothetical protein
MLGDGCGTTHWQGHVLLFNMTVGLGNVLLLNIWWQQIFVVVLPWLDTVRLSRSGTCKWSILVRQA